MRPVDQPGTQSFIVYTGSDFCFLGHFQRANNLLFFNNHTVKPPGLNFVGPIACPVVNNQASDSYDAGNLTQFPVAAIAFPKTTNYDNIFGSPGCGPTHAGEWTSIEVPCEWQNASAYASLGIGAFNDPLGAGGNGTGLVFADFADMIQQVDSGDYSSDPPSGRPTFDSYGRDTATVILAEILEAAARHRIFWWERQLPGAAEIPDVSSLMACAHSEAAASVKDMHWHVINLESPIGALPPPSWDPIANLSRWDSYNDFGSAIGWGGDYWGVPFFHNTTWNGTVCSANYTNPNATGIQFSNVSYVNSATGAPALSIPPFLNGKAIDQGICAQAVDELAKCALPTIRQWAVCMATELVAKMRDLLTEKPWFHKENTFFPNGTTRPPPYGSGRGVCSEHATTPTPRPALNRAGGGFL